MIIVVDCRYIYLSILLQNIKITNDLQIVFSRKFVEFFGGIISDYPRNDRGTEYCDVIKFKICLRLNGKVKTTIFPN